MKIKFKTFYDFYDLSEDDRKTLIGKSFKEEKGQNHYFPVQLAMGEFNYGKRQGLLRVSEMLLSNGNLWFRVSAASPDDLDADLDFEGMGVDSLRRKVLAYVKRMNKINVTYRGLLGEIQEYFNAGEITS